MSNTETNVAPPSSEKIDFLDEDTVHVTGQKYALVSFVSPDHVEGQPKGSGKVAVKIRGAFDNIEQAQHHVKKIAKADNSVHTYVVDMYKWLLAPPDTDKIKDQIYHEEFLQNLFKGYKDSRAVAAEAFKKRVDKVKKHGIDEDVDENERMPKKELTPADFKVGDQMPEVDLPDQTNLK